MRKWSITACIILHSVLYAQGVATQLETATKELMNSAAAYSANLSFYVADDQGRLIYEYQGTKGLSSASTQKIFSAAAALETLGEQYRYTSTSSYTGTIENGKLNGNIIFTSTGDPTLGSWRYEETKPEKILRNWITSLKKEGIKSVSGNIIVDDSYFDRQTIPGGWPWDDVGNYYGAGVWGVNWRENQFDVKTKGKDITGFSYPLVDVKWYNDLTEGGSSDQSLIFTAPQSNVALINGMLPAKQNTVSGSTPNPPLQLAYELKQELLKNGISFDGDITTTSLLRLDGKSIITSASKTFFTHQSPTLDKIIYWFMRKSVNLYGETFIKTLGIEKKKNSSFKTGVNYLKDFWKSKGIEPAMINFADGSGLSPQNYVSAKAEVQALLYSKSQPWFDVFYEGFPVAPNGLKMKSGTMRNTKSYAGFHTSSNGKTYVFAIIINNYQGNGSEALQTILNQLK